jgi:hypothetical protein
MAIIPCGSTSVFSLKVAQTNVKFFIRPLIISLFCFEKIKAIGQTELNASNPEEVLQLAAQRRKKKFLQAMAKLYF